ncbi:MAG: argininosuccinate lyase [Fimbriimonadaceae bacterium]|nr:argininosuccinate lyase [Fimbriimonadaceae bacterium]
MSSNPWAGRFAGNMAASMAAYTESLAVDARMIAEDIWGSQVHALMLHRCGHLDDAALATILHWLERARADHERGSFVMRAELEDVHMNVETYLIQGAGAEFGGRLHAARSRNDQVLTDCRLYVRARLLSVEDALLELATTTLALAAQHTRTVMPGYTHSQHAQPITAGYWLSAHVAGWLRDLRRLQAAYRNLNTSPLGACALAGTDLRTDREYSARLLGFDAVLEHALDATSARDFLAEALSALTLLMVALSRLGEELVWFSSHEFGLLELADAFTSGSSIMPQKKNPDCAELTRGKAGRVIGDLVQLLTVLKSVSLGYSRDLQEDKPPVWDALDQVHGALRVLTGALGSITLRPERMRAMVDANFATATQLANWLVAARDVPFRQAHEIVGRLVGEFTRQGCTLTATAEVVAQLAGAGIAASAAEVAAVLDPLQGVERQASQGGPAPGETARLIAGYQTALAAARADWRQRVTAVSAARDETARLVAAALSR